MYRIVKHSNGDNFFTGHIPRREWITATVSSYIGEKSDLDSIKDVWIPVCRGSYPDVKRKMEAWARTNR